MKKNAYSSDSVKQYLKAIGRIALLTHEQEIVLGKAVQQLIKLENIATGMTEQLSRQPNLTEWAEAADLSEEMLEQAVSAGKRAKTKMVESNLRLVVSVAKKYLGNRLELMDLIQEGTIGLQRAVEKFDPSKGYRFSTYSYWWIRQAMTRAIAQSSRTIRLPIHIGEKLSKMRKLERQLLLSLNRPATNEEVAEAMSLSVEQVRQLKVQRRLPISLDLRVGNEQNTGLVDLLETDALSPEEFTNQQQLKRDLNHLLQSLPNQQSDVIRMRFGIGTGSKAMTLAQIGKQLGLSRERVRQIEKVALKSLRKRGDSMRDYAIAS